MSRFTYTALLYLLLPFTPLKLLWRGIRQPAYLQHVAERYGFYSQQTKKPLIWLHCVSVGETRAAAPLVAELQRRYPQHQILLTHATPTGREAGEQLFGGSVERAYLPYDVPDAMSRFLNHFQPELGLLMETELWFNLIAACKQRKIPLLLVNARLSQGSAHGYAKFPRLSAHALRSLAAIAAQTEQDAARLRGLGANHVEVMGNLKFDVAPPTDAVAQGKKLRALLGKNRPVFLAASTREGEEAMILEAVAAAQIPQLLTIIVPRHPQRFDEVASLLKKRDITFIRKSLLPSNEGKREREGEEEALKTVQAVRQGADDAADKVIVKPHCSVVLGDSMGELFTYYAACDVAFIGGSLLSYGGQNLIEACIMGKPVLLGPHTYNFELATEQAIALGAALRVSDSADLAATLLRVFADEKTRKSMGLAALEFSNSASGATQRIADLAGHYLPRT